MPLAGAIATALWRVRSPLLSRTRMDGPNLEPVGIGAITAATRGRQHYVRGTVAMLFDSAAGVLRVVLRDPDAPPGTADIDVHFYGEFAKRLQFLRSKVGQSRLAAQRVGDVATLLSGASTRADSRPLVPLRDAKDLLTVLGFDVEEESADGDHSCKLAVRLPACQAVSVRK